MHSGLFRNALALVSHELWKIYLMLAAVDAVEFLVDASCHMVPLVEESDSFNLFH